MPKLTAVSLHMAYLLPGILAFFLASYSKSHLLTAALAKNTCLPLTTSHHPFGSSATGLPAVLSNLRALLLLPPDHNLPGSPGLGPVHMGMPCRVSGSESSVYCWSPQQEEGNSMEEQSHMVRGLLPPWVPHPRANHKAQAGPDHFSLLEIR